MENVDSKFNNLNEDDIINLDINDNNDNDNESINSNVNQSSILESKLE